MEASSPAALAGLIAHDDFIVGADQVLQDVSVLVFVLLLLIQTNGEDASIREQNMVLYLTFLHFCSQRISSL